MLMDTMMQAYMEETYELMQRAEDCIIRLEKECSDADINELFRIAHTIKGTSHVIGFEDVGNLMHKLEDMLDHVRNGYILFDQNIVSLCFEGLDTVKKMLENKSETCSPEINDSLDRTASGISNTIEEIINANKSKQEESVEEKETGFVSSLLRQRKRGKNKYYMSFFIEKDAPMVSPVFMMILKKVEEIGSLTYSSVDDYFFTDTFTDSDVKSLDIIINSDMEENQLYILFNLIYIEKINIVDLSRRKLKMKDVYLNNTGLNHTGCTTFKQDLFEVFSKHLIKTFKPDKEGFTDKIRVFAGSLTEEAILMVLIDTSQLNIIDENEVKELIALKRQLSMDNIDLAILVGGPCERRIINIFDSIRAIEDFRIYRNGMEAVQKVFGSEECFKKLSKVVKDVLNDDE